MRQTTRRFTWATLSVGCGLALLTATTAPGVAAPQAPADPPAAASLVTAPAAVKRHTDKNPTAFGTGGAVASVDPEATAAGLAVLKRGGNAVDAAVATAAALGVTEPYSAGIGGGGYFVYYDARTRKISTLDGRETAPASMPRDAFLDPATGKPYNFFPELVTSGVSVGVPGTPATWESALSRWGTLSLKQALKPAVKLARRGFVVDSTFRSQTLDNKARFSAISTTADLYLPGGDAPQLGSIFRNPDLAATYEAVGREGTQVIYQGRIGSDIVRTVHNPPSVEGTKLPVPAGFLERSDLASYKIVRHAPTKVRYRGLDVYSIAPSSSGGSTVGEALKILGTTRLWRCRAPPRCTATWTRRRSRSPTGTPTWATRRTWTCRSGPCSQRSSPAPGPAGSIRSRHSPHPPCRGSWTGRGVQRGGPRARATGAPPRPTSSPPTVGGMSSPTP